MTQSLFAGSTNYTSQTLAHMVKDLKNFITLVVDTPKSMAENVQRLETANYWATVPQDFRMLIEYTINWFGKTALSDMRQILRDLPAGVRENHVRRLQAIGKQAIQLNRDYGKVWHQDYGHKDYDSPEFRVVETLYKDGRGMMTTLMDMDNLAVRLEDFIDATPWYKRWWIIGPWILGVIGGIIAIVQSFLS